jgi:alanyl-tRNA synthetase
MLGNWSLGDYFKEEMVEMSYEFLIDVLKLDKERIGISCFKGDKDASKDTVSAKKWESLNIPKERIVFLPKSENWWESPGETGPCGYFEWL